MLDILNSRLQHHLRHITSALPYEQREQVKSIRLCGMRPISQIGVPSHIYLMRSSENEAKFFGNITCKNTWACPHCSVVQMTKYRRKIGALIDACDDINLDGFMMTFTIPHLKFQFCHEVTDLLYQTWQATFANVWSKRFTKSGAPRYNSPMNKFFLEQNVKYYVRVGEYTHGENGWHPHFHVLFFVPKGNLKTVVEYEQSILQHWINSFKRIVEKYYSVKKNKELHDEKLIDQYKKHFNKTLYNKIYPAVTISKAENGSAYKVTSAAYVAGWTSDQEMTGNVQKKASHEGHRTPLQILEDASNGDKESEQLYIEFLLNVTRKPVHHRVNFSKNGAGALAQNKLNQAGYQEVLKKKSQTAKWELVCYFTSEEWQRLFFADFNEPTLQNILYLASIRRDDLLKEYLQFYNVKFRVQKIPIAQHVENIFNNAA